MPWWLVPYQLFFPMLGVGVALKMLAAGRGKSLREGRDPIRQRFGLLRPDELARIQGRVVWIHAASVGEVQAASPLVAKIAALPDRPKILLTSSTFAGRERGRQVPGVDLAVLAPIDFYPAVRAFLEKARPSVLILVETELWPMTIYLSLRRGVRLAIVNGRVSERSFPRYRLLRLFLAPLLRHVSMAAVQTDGEKERYVALGVRPDAVHATGNLKLDLPPPGETERAKGRRILSSLGWEGAPVWVAASTRPGEEEAVLEAFAAIRTDHKQLRLVLAPRHVERSAEVSALLSKNGTRFTSYSEFSQSPSRSGQAPSPDCLLVDQLGHLTDIYAVATIAFVGGTLVPVGGHNLLEPALCGIPVLYGPHFSTQSMSAEALRRTGGGIVVSDARGLAREIYKLLKNEPVRLEVGRNALAAALSLSGASGRTMGHLGILLARTVRD